MGRYSYWPIFMSSFLGKLLAGRLNVGQSRSQDITTDVSDVNPMYEMIEPFALGIDETKDTKRRQRKEIYTTWHHMQRDPSISEALGLHVTAALGGHETRAEMIFISPNPKIAGSGAKNKDLRNKVEQSQKRLSKILNQNCVKLCRDAVAFGDAYSRIYGQQGVGVVDAMCNEHTFPPLIQAFEQGSFTIGYHGLEAKDWERSIAKLTNIQMLRMKMPRVSNVPQRDTVEGLIRAKLLHADLRSDMPIIPAQVGGSFLFEIEEPWKNFHLTLAGMNSQQIADSVKQMFMSIDMSGMPLSARDVYKKALNKMVNGHQEYVRKALEGGEQIWGTKYHFLPTWGDKQVLNAVGDLSGQRTAPLDTEFLMLNLRRMMGGMGSDPSMVGWADMLAGGLGDGAAFHTSAQVMRRSQMIRMAKTNYANDLIKLDWAYAYNEYPEGDDLPWQVEYYSDQSAAATEALTNKQTRLNTLMLSTTAIATLKDLGMDVKTNVELLANLGGFDDELAKMIATSLKNAPPTDNDGFGDPTENQPIEPPKGDAATQANDDEGDD